MMKKSFLVFLSTLILGCGGSEPDAAGSTTPVDEAESRPAGEHVEVAPVDFDSFEHRAVIDLRHGQLVVAANGARPERIAIGLRAEDGDLVLSHCDFLEGHADHHDAELGPAAYSRLEDGSEQLIALAPSASVLALAEAERAIIVTCEEDIPITADAMEELRAFLQGDEYIDHVTHSRSLALDGAHLAFSFRTESRDRILLDFTLDSHQPSGCEQMSLRAGSRSVAITDVTSSGEHTRGRTTRAALERAVTQRSARLTMCGRVFSISRVELQNIATLLHEE